MGDSARLREAAPVRVTVRTGKATANGRKESRSMRYNCCCIDQECAERQEFVKEWAGRCLCIVVGRRGEVHEGWGKRERIGESDEATERRRGRHGGEGVLRAGS